jgi:hypothetical protein
MLNPLLFYVLHEQVLENLFGPILGTLLISYDLSSKILFTCFLVFLLKNEYLTEVLVLLQSIFRQK